MPPRAKIDDGTLALRQLAPASPSARRVGCGLAFVGSLASKSNDRSHCVPGRACLSLVPGDGQGIIAAAPYGTGYHAPLRPSGAKNQESVGLRPVSLTMRTPQHGDLERKSVMHSPQGSGPGVSRPSVVFQQGPGAMFQGFSSCETPAVILGPKLPSNVSASKTPGQSVLPGSPPSRKPGTGVYMPGSVLPSGQNRTQASNATGQCHSSKGHATCTRASANLSPPSPRQPHHHHGNHQHHHQNIIHHNPQHRNGQMQHTMEYHGIVNSPGGARQAVSSPGAKAGSPPGVLPSRAVHHSLPSSHLESPDALRGTRSPRSPQVLIGSPRHMIASPRASTNQLQSPPPRTPPPFIVANAASQEWTMDSVAAAARRSGIGRWSPRAGSGPPVKGWCNNMVGNSTTTAEPFTGSAGHCGHHAPPWSPTSNSRSVQPQQRQAPTSPHALHMEYNSTEERMMPTCQTSSKGVSAGQFGSVGWQQQCFSHFGVDATLREVLDFSIKMQQQVQLAAMTATSEPQAIPSSPYKARTLPPRPGQPTSPKSPLDEALEAEEEWQRQQQQKRCGSLRSPAELKELEVAGVFLPSEDELGAGWS